MAVRVTTLKGPSAGEYYTRELELGRYYTQEQEPPGRWLGVQADAFGLEGEVQPTPFLRLMAGLDPHTEAKLGRAYGASSARGYDVTFNAPKSVSLLAEFADQQMRAQVLAAHDAAIDRVLTFVERQAHTRTTVQGVTSVVDTQGLSVAAFRQYTSRAGDPHLHTHAVVAAKVRDDRGRWLALDARMIKHDQRTLSALYHSCLRAELTRRVGVQWQEPVNGIAELVGIDEPVLGRFSTRTDQLETRVQAKLDRFRVSFGREPGDMERWRLEREAACDSRPSKNSIPQPEELPAVWRAELAELGVTPEELVGEVVGRQLEPAGIGARQAAQIITAVELELCETVSTWRRNDVIREIARRIPTTVTSLTPELVEWIEYAADQVIERQVELAPRIAPGTPVRRDGRPITESTLDRRYTTERILTEEEYLLTWALDRQYLPGHPAELSVDGLDRAQQLAARTVAGTDPLVVIVGPAGAGKTSTLQAAVTRLAGDGRPVFGIAPSATAAAVLAQQTAVDSDTVDKLLYEHTRTDRPPERRYQLPRGTTLLADEAGMIPTPKLAHLAQLADRHQWRVVLIGDPRQLGAVGRSGMFDCLVDTGRVIELEQIHRFTHQWERTASLQLRRGAPDALDAYQSRQRIHDGTRIDMQRAAVAAWTDCRRHGDNVVMLAVTHDTVDTLNRAAQTVRIRAGQLDPQRSVPASNGVVHVGDEIVTRRNDRTLRTDRSVMVRNRAHWTVTELHRDGSVTARNPDGTVRLPADYMSTFVELGYAQTVHAAQGATLDRCLLIVDGPIDGRALYVGMTRGRDSNHIYVAVDANHTARDLLDAALAANWSDRPAIEVRAELAARPVTPFAPPTGEARVGVLPADDLRAVHAEHRALRALDLRFHEQRLQRLEREDGVDRRQLQQAHIQRDALTRQLATVTAQRAVLSSFGHKHERQDLDQQIKQLHQQRVSAGGDITSLDHRIEQRAADLATERRLEADHAGMSIRERELGVALDIDAGGRGHAATRDTLGYLTNSLGPVPDDPNHRTAWERTAGTIEQYRTLHNITDPHRALGPELDSRNEPALAWEQQRIAQQAHEVHDLAIPRGISHELGHSLGR